MNVTTHDWQILGMYGFLLAVVGSFMLYVHFTTGRHRRRKAAR